ncbi:hypothetical protein VTN77DRAFT_7677 [Rasamsonia byssochlamydoides]|uniref:uncharacterized protein n=1 Tax=Rasamsonia byssochlamydoides TaxID=89139 RepID=UPI003743F257
MAGKAFSLKFILPKTETAVGLKVHTDGHEFPITEVNQIFDDETSVRDYPKGYTFDLALLKPLVPIVLLIDEPQKKKKEKRRFRPKAAGLPFNELLRLLSPRVGSDSIAEGKTFPSGFGTAVGEAFVYNNENGDAADGDDRAEKSNDDSPLARLSRCTLWRMMAGPDHSPLCISSGSPVEVVSTGEILGFQCWQWARGAKYMARNDTKEAVRARMLAMRYSFYGIYELPDEVEKMSIVERS